MEREIERLQNHFIVCGAGRVGSCLISVFKQQRQDFVAVESNAPAADKLAADKVLVVVGDATDSEVLTRAGVTRARGIAATLPTDAENLYVTLLARDLNPALQIVARANDLAAAPRLRKAGANRVVSPSQMGARRMAEDLVRPAVADFFEHALYSPTGDLRIEEVGVSAASPLAGLSLRDSRMREELNVMVIGIRRADGAMIFNPGGDTLIHQDDRLVAAGENQGLDALEKKARGETGNAKK